MIDKVMCLINALTTIGKVTYISMSDTYSSINFEKCGKRYMVSLMTIEEEKEDDSV